MEIIAEIGQNHNGDMKLARDLIIAAKKNGADAVKFQVYDAATLFPRDENPWYDYNLSTELSQKKLSEIAKFCDDLEIEFLASVFDVERVEWLEELGVRRYKVASRSIQDTPLIERLVKTQKPLLVSLGMWKEKTFPTIEASSRIDYLYCVSKYPTPLSDLKLGQVDFSIYSGFSDHTIGITSAIVALARGAKIIEKHFTLDKNMYGPDHNCSMTPNELKKLCHHRDEITILL